MIPPKAQKISRFCFFLILFLFFSATILFGTREAAEAKTTVYFKQDLPANEKMAEFSVRLVVDSNEPLNAYDIMITYPTALLRVKNINTSRSIIDVWQNNPQTEESEGKITLRGGTMKPFAGEEGELVTISFRAMKVGNGELSFEEATVYLADGRGTKVSAETVATPVEIYSLALEGGEEKDLHLIDVQKIGLLKDTVPPTINFLKVERNPFFHSEKLLIFDVRDSGGGVKMSLVRTRSWFSWSAWQEALNPYPFPFGVWTVHFRVLDNEGNIAERVLYQWNIFASKAILSAIFLGLVPWFIWKWKRKKREE